ncbi:MAG TPA: sulfatase-like hydrolase/transferase [Candidatus Binatia bacterium]
MRHPEPDFSSDRASLPRRSPSPLRRALALALLALALLAGVVAPAASQERPPNVVLIIGDDHGWPYSGFMGDPYVQTPHLDALAAGGTVFDNAHATASTCVPSLRSVLAGLHPQQWDAEVAAVEARIGPFGFRQGVTHVRTLPRELARHGYLSWEGGKMWESTYANAGFTHGLATGPGELLAAVGSDFGRTGFTEGKALDPLREFLDEASDRPFFLWFAPQLPHTPFDAPDELRAPYVALGLSAAEIAYYANVTWLDALVGELVAELDARGLRDDTLLIYLSDNGWGITQPIAGAGKGKGTLYELGFRTPLVFNWPGRVPAGVVRHDLVSLLDVMPTILEFAGAEPLDDRPGLSLVDAITSGTPVGRDAIVGRYNGTQPANRGHFVRTRTWRYIRFDDGREELYAIATDPYEDLDIAGERPDVLEEMRGRIDAWEAALTHGPQRLEAAGRVTDLQGRPLGGVTLQLRGRTHDRKPVRLRVQTSPRGEFVFAAVPHGSYQLTALRGAKGLRWGPLWYKVPLDLPLHALGTYTPLVAATNGKAAPGTGRVYGMVRDALGTPVADATIMLSGGAPHRSFVVVRSDAHGRYRAEHLPAGAYRLTAGGSRPLRPLRQRFELADGEQLLLDLTLSGVVSVTSAAKPLRAPPAASAPTARR